jgi:hypothetical protein
LRRYFQSLHNKLLCKINKLQNNIRSKITYEQNQINLPTTLSSPQVRLLGLVVYPTPKLLRFVNAFCRTWKLLNHVRFKHFYSYGHLISITNFVAAKLYPICGAGFCIISLYTESPDCIGLVNFWYLMKLIFYFSRKCSSDALEKVYFYALKPSMLVSSRISVANLASV